jgi:G3E family GTPase
VRIHFIKRPVSIAVAFAVQQQHGRTATADHIKIIDAADFSRAAREFIEHGANYPLSTVNGEQVDFARTVGRSKADTLLSLTQATVGKRDAVKI